MENYEKLKVIMEDMEHDMKQFYNRGNSAAGTRARKKLQDLKKISHEIRVDIQEKKQLKK